MTFDETDHLCNGVFWWDRYQYMNMIRLKMPFNYFAFFLPGKTVYLVSKVLPYPAKQNLAPTFGNPYYVVLAIPLRVT
jgi:hypothetical protein